jgi:hypothetical protein
MDGAEEEKRKKQDATNKRIREWYARNIEDQRKKNREKQKKRRVQNPEKFREKVRSCRKRNREKRLAKDRERYARDPERFKGIRRDWYYENQEVHLAAVRAWRKANPDKVKMAKRKHLYGITDEDFKKIFDAGKGKCHVCKRPFDMKEIKPHVDHCHNTNVVRGLLCFECNAAEGLLRNPETVLALYEYMTKNHLFYQKSLPPEEVKAA